MDRRIVTLPRPEPVSRTEAYIAERNARLGAYPACAANYAKLLGAGPRKPEVDYLPTKLDIENVSRCNFQCTMCMVSEWPKGRRAADMPVSAFESLIDSNLGLLEIKLQGIGEPTLGGGRLPRYDRVRA